MGACDAAAQLGLISSIQLQLLVFFWLQLVQKPSSLEPDSSGGLPANADAAAAAADPMTESHGLSGPRDNDTATAMEGLVEGDESNGQHGGSSADAASAAQKVCSPET